MNHMKRISEPDWQQIKEWASGGDEGWENLLLWIQVKFGPFVSRSISPALHANYATADALQSVSRTLLRRRDIITAKILGGAFADKKSFEAYLYTVHRNTLPVRNRDNRAERLGDDSPPLLIASEAEVFESACRRERSAKIREAIAEVLQTRPNGKRALILSYLDWILEGSDTKPSGLSEDVARTTLTRFRKDVRKKLVEWGFEIDVQRA
jgi:hypothetical protein